MWKAVLLILLLVPLAGNPHALGAGSQDRLPDELLPIVHSQQNKGQKTAYLTFDDGPSVNTAAILDILDKYGIKATFFVMWHDEPTADAAYKEMVKRGHTVALHTYSHDYEKVYGSPESFFTDMKKLEAVLAKYGVKSQLFRFPGGSRNLAVQHGPKKQAFEQIKAGLKERGYVYFDWTIDSEDGFSPYVSKENITRKILKEAREEKEMAVILLHDIHAMKNTVKALPGIIEGLIAQGYSFDRITDYTPAVQFGQK